MSKRRSPFESDDRGLDLVALDLYRPSADELEFVVTVDDVDDLDFELTVEEPAASPCPVDLEGAVAALQQVSHRDMVLDLLVQPVIPGVTLSVVLLVRDGVATGQRSCGSPAPSAEVKGLVLPLAAPSLLWQAAEHQQVCRGTAGSDPTQQVISRYLRAPDAAWACAAPVVLGRRVVNLVCLQTTRQAGIGDHGLDALRRMCEAAAAGYRQLIRGQARAGS